MTTDIIPLLLASEAAASRVVGCQNVIRIRRVDARAVWISLDPVGYPPDCHGYDFLIDNPEHLLRGQALCHYRRFHGGAARRAVRASKTRRCAGALARSPSNRWSWASGYSVSHRTLMPSCSKASAMRFSRTSVGIPALLLTSMTMVTSAPASCSCNTLNR
jgi:hypothetical protein